jgi:hypothetical protein
LEPSFPGDPSSDHLILLSGTEQNIAGLVVYVLATIGTDV